ncbi:hypothetical protein ES703_66078 [subsurface metagenome]
MAKLKAPLLSLGASGAIGKSIVFFPWKGIDAVREYVIPANPKTDPQILQRSYLTAAVATIHNAEAHTIDPLSAVDKTAYALYGSTFPTPRTWFNQIVQRWLLAEVNGEKATVYKAGTFTDPATTEITITLRNQVTGGQAGSFYCGTSKTSMPKSVVADGVGTLHTGVFTGLTKGVKYFFQFRPDPVADAKYVCRSGIYHHVST